ncbi:hypothetical protein C8Q69DRAFT_293102 [Paecilomyces variotii]|uniref:Uncharacterized protein n=1 Tax=Byssochlamys spectabilis TaxID=264951 RepID=A0A443HRR1_BYSSP|nr:hypothetical protein C8Q69DRAFT_293102 [Paecilomyces variotii]RWQ94459.1 hypothetical protein C8Q69DRAFT_293102 [Paecilomyces variotii]
MIFARLASRASLLGKCFEQSDTRSRHSTACMRMRELGRGQSVVFCVPPEIQYNIRAMGTKSNSSHITVSDILTWAVSETWIDTTKRYRYGLHKVNDARSRQLCGMKVVPTTGSVCPLNKRQTS